MSPDEHYIEAEKCLETALAAEHPRSSDWFLHAAQIHATLATVDPGTYQYVIDAQKRARTWDAEKAEQ